MEVFPGFFTFAASVQTTNTVCHLYFHFGEILGKPCTLAEVFGSADGNIPGVHSGKENQFAKDLDNVMKATVRTCET